MSKKITMNEESEEVKLDVAFREFLQYSKAKNLSERTLDYYEYNYNRFKEFLKNEGIDYINKVNHKVVQQFTLYLNDKIENGISVNNILRAIRAFLYYCMKLNYLDQFKVEMVKAKKKVKEFLTKCVNEDLIIEETELNYLMSSGSIGPAFSSNSFVKT